MQKSIISPNDIAKKAAGIHAAKLVEDGMILGIGSGSTVYFFIQHLIDRLKKGLKIQTIPSSSITKKLLMDGGIPIVNEGNESKIDLTVDGADEIDKDRFMIKGHGGALLREKIIATSSHQMCVIIDESKRVNHLGKTALPIEILPFCSQITANKINELGYVGEIRLISPDTPYITDNGNFIYDINLDYPCIDPKTIEQKLLSIPGVLETGFFFNRPKKIIIGYADGHTDVV